MDKMFRSISLKESEYRSLAQLIHDKSGINLGLHKQELLKTRLGKRLRALGLNSYGEYFNYVCDLHNDEELGLLINAISTNFTSFYREPRHYEFLLKTVLKDISEKKQALRSKKIRGWCAAASSGEEPYSLGISLLEYFNGQPDWDIKLLATDISTKVLSQADQGIYKKESVRTINPVLLDRYFDKEPGQDDTMYRIKDEVKSLITFRKLNLMDATYPFRGLFDFIFCRNVMIYFDQSTQETLVTKFLKYLVPGGYFFTGLSENLPPGFRSRFEILAPATYKKIPRTGGGGDR